MTWKMIGQSVPGLSHLQAGKGCDDAVCYQATCLPGNEAALICFVSDGAGSARHAARASQLVTELATARMASRLAENTPVSENELYLLAEYLLDELENTATAEQEPVDEYLCTLLGCILLPDCAYFLQVGDGAIIRNDGSGNYTHIWWPDNGEYQNTTFFLTGSKDLRNLKVLEIREQVAEVAIFTDGLQMLALNNETISVHQPFFKDMFRWLRMASNKEHIKILDKKLADYLGSDLINSKTDDDKTLFLATRLQDDHYVQGHEK